MTMTLQGHTRRCLLASSVALLVAGLAVFPGLEADVRAKTAACTALALLGCFFVARWLAARNPQPPRGDQPLDGLPPGVAGVALMTLWMPVLLALAVVVLRVGFGAEAARVSWELIVIAGMVGQHAWGAWAHRGGR
jgi:hypothetical protein